MLKRGFLTKKPERDSKVTRKISIAGRILLYSGIIILIIALIFMSVNFAEADSIIGVWLPFMIAGVFLVFMSQLVNWNFSGHHRS